MKQFTFCFPVYRNAKIQMTFKSSFSFSEGSPRSCEHSLRIRMASCPCNKYKLITPSHLLRVKYRTSNQIIRFLRTTKNNTLRNGINNAAEIQLYSGLIYLHPWDKLSCTATTSSGVFGYVHVIPDQFLGRTGNRSRTI